MSQYQPPYVPPPNTPLPYQPMTHEPLAMARRASVLMFVLGGLMLAMGACNALSSALVPAQQLIENQQKIMPNGEVPFSAEVFKTMSIIAGVLMVVCGCVYIALGSSVRGGSKGSTIASVVITSVLLLFVGLMLLACLIGGLAQPALLVMVILPAVPFALLTMLLIWLVRALRASQATPQYSAQQMQYAAQYWQHQQQVQQSGGYGYAPPPPIAPVNPQAPQQPYPSSPPTTGENDGRSTQG
jgi:hypothetical protein